MCVVLAATGSVEKTFFCHVDYGLGGVSNGFLLGLFDFIIGVEDLHERRNSNAFFSCYLLVFPCVASGEVHLVACIGELLGSLLVLGLHELALAAVRKVEHDHPDLIRSLGNLVPVFSVQLRDQRWVHDHFSAEIPGWLS